jgi:uncharacterized membrane protein YdbT with pleckstrin-like domain
MDNQPDPKKTYSIKDYPIRTIWLFKSALSGGVGMLITIVIIGVFLVPALSDSTDSSAAVISIGFIVFAVVFFFLFGVVFNLAILALQRSAFSFSFEDNFIVLHQGIISRQQRTIPYAVLQDVIVKQDLFDTLLGLSSLTVENAVQTPIMGGGRNGYQYSRYSRNSLGFSGNRVSIPGLSKADAQTLKLIVLAKMKQNQVHPSVTGL